MHLRAATASWHAEFSGVASASAQREYSAPQSAILSGDTGVLARHQDRCRFSVIRAARRSCYVKSNLAVVDEASAPATLRSLVFAAFLPADLSFRFRAAFFAAELRFVGMDIPPKT